MDDLQGLGNLGKAMWKGKVSRAAFAAEFMSDEDRLRMWHSAKQNHQWPAVFGASPWFPAESNAFLMLRVLLAAIFVGHWVAHISVYFENGFWFIYLTHWSLTVQTVYFCIAAWTTYAARRNHQKGYQHCDEHALIESRLPWFVTAQWILYHIVQPAALMVCALYWTLENPVWNMVRTPTYLGVFVHGINLVLCMCDLVLGNVAFYLKYAVYFLAYAIMFVVWTRLHEWARVGTYLGCDQYESSGDCPIYDVLDWKHVESTRTLCLVVVCVVAPLCQCPLWWCTAKRQAVSAYLKRDAVAEASGWNRGGGNMLKA